MINLALNQVDIFYISYDEPNCEKHWANLLEIAPWAKRVHGVKGFDAAHKRCAAESETDFFITVDGDNLIDPTFLDETLSMPDHYVDCVLSWSSRNVVNGLVYGNGGLKLWPKRETLLMNTHEAATETRLALDFCWDDKYIQMNNVYSETFPNGSPFQAFRAGFREGVKMTVHSGQNIDPAQLERQVHQKNLKRLLIWMSVGADELNGKWAMYGARLGLIKANLDPSFDILNVRDYDWFYKYWTEEIWSLYDAPSTKNGKMTGAEPGCWYPDSMDNALDVMGKQIRQETGLKTGLLKHEESEFFKFVYEAPQRTSALRTEIQVDSGAA